MKSLVSVSVGGQKRKHIVAVWGTESNSAVFWSLYVSVCRISQQITTLTQLLTKYLYLVFQWWYKRAFFFFLSTLTDFICLKGNLLGIEQRRWNIVISKFFITTQSTYCSIHTIKQVSYWILFSRNGLQCDWIPKRDDLKKYINQSNSKLPTMFSWVWVSMYETIWEIESAFLFSIGKRNV